MRSTNCTFRLLQNHDSSTVIDISSLVQGVVKLLMPDAVVDVLRTEALRREHQLILCEPVYLLNACANNRNGRFVVIQRCLQQPELPAAELICQA